MGPPGRRSTICGSGRLDYFDEHVLSLPYWVANPHPRVLVIGVGGGRDVVAAVRYGASSVTGVELDPVTLDLIRDELADIHAGFFSPRRRRADRGRGPTLRQVDAATASI